MQTKKISKQAILKVAEKIFAQKGYVNTSLTDIANKLHITKPALYYYFDSKKQIAKSILENLGDEIVNSLEKIKQEKNKNIITLLVNNFINFKDKKPSIAMIFFINPRASKISKCLKKQKQKVVSKILEILSVAPQTKDLDMVHKKLITSSLLGLICSEFSESEKKQIPDIFTNFLIENKNYEKK